MSFECPCCVGSGQRLAIFFANPISGQPADVSNAGFKKRIEARHLEDHHIGDMRWQRTGETFEALTLSPSIDCSAWGHWHGFLTNGYCS